MDKTGILYFLKSKNSDKIYVGSTFRKMNARFAQHKNMYNDYVNKGKGHYVSSYEIFKLGDYYVDQIQEFPNISKDDLKKIEGKAIHDTPTCVNKNIAGRTYEQYYQDNIDKIHNYKNEKHLCDCGKYYTQVNRARHFKTKKHME